MEIFHVEDTIAGVLTLTSSEDVGGVIRWRTYEGKPRSLVSEVDASPDQIEQHERAVEMGARVSRQKRAAAFMPWLKNVSSNWDSLSVDQKLARTERLFDELYDVLKELKVGE